MTIPGVLMLCALKIYNPRASTCVKLVKFTPISKHIFRKLPKNGTGNTYLTFGGITDEPFRIREGNIAGGGSVALVVGDDFDFAVLPYSYTGIRGAQVNPDGFPHFRFSRK